MAERESQPYKYDVGILDLVAHGGQIKITPSNQKEHFGHVVVLNDDKGFPIEVNIWLWDYSNSDTVPVLLQKRTVLNIEKNRGEGFSNV